MRIDAVSEEARGSSWESYQKYQLLSKEKENGISDSDFAAGGTQESASTKRINEAGGCETCKNRKYQDGSNDPGVSFKTPTNISPDQAAGAVRAHEMEHVTRERGKAVREERKVVAQSVTYQNAICPECKTAYISGGTTRTTTASAPENEGSKIDTYA